ncbi:polyprenol monophosphomannose synthase [Leekyejoonella antrihumi]|uniref:Polyprenol monophosphomannose synthase n=1 Tax=Leekyejoonella antrihumi TaxID=1660198 RepID=A0A563E366_9MICO|nr:polyprenol monophosphomannose synthase [Leekyejoonella antrihumi]TWP36855.1 polyprenol monophosphomannose synthase [Leekyejoonella antrihumi]
MKSSSPRPATAPDRRPLEHVLVLVPTYNEHENLPLIVQRLRSSVPDADIMVLDDNSPDGTGKIADELAAADSRVRVMHREDKEGLGKAYLAGFAWGLEHGYDALVEIDADGSHPPEVLPDMLAAAADADLVIGSRWVPGGKVVNWPLQRELLSRGANLYTRALLGMPVGDATAGYRVYRASTVRTIGLQGIASQGYCFQVDLTWQTLRAGLSIVEVPITFVEREIGDSKMSRDIMLESLTKISGWGIQHRWGQLRSLAGRAGGRSS